MLKRILRTAWRAFARWRTWLVNTISTVLFMLPEIIGLLSQAISAPEVVAVLPDGWYRWLAALIFVLNLWMRPRPAVLADDPEAEVYRQRHAARRSSKR